MGCYSTGFPGNSFVGGYLLSSAFWDPNTYEKEGKDARLEGQRSKGKKSNDSLSQHMKVQEPVALKFFWIQNSLKAMPL